MISVYLRAFFVAIGLFCLNIIYAQNSETNLRDLENKLGEQEKMYKNELLYFELDKSDMSEERKLEAQKRLQLKEQEIIALKEVVHNLKIKKIKNFGGHPKSLGYNLTKTNTIDGLKCEHYDKDGDKIRVFYNSKGDYIIVPEDKDGFDFAPKSFSNMRSYRMHTNTGIIFEGVIQDTDYKFTYENGNVEYIFNTGKNCISGYFFDWDDFKKGNTYLWPKTFDEFFDFDHNDINRTLIRYYKDERWIVLANNPNEIIKYHAGTNRCNWEYGGYKIGNNLYSLTSEGNLKLVFKEFEGDYIPCLPSDSIVSFKCEDYYNYEIHFANGDWLKQRDGAPFGLLHRGGNIIKFDYDDPDKEWARIVYPNGSVFAGAIYHPSKEDLPGYGGHDDLRTEFWYPWRGYLRYPDGKSIAYERGETAAERSARETAKAQEEMAKNKAVYDTACKMYGKKYIDAVLKGNIIVGMPEELVVGIFKTRLAEVSGNSKCYHIYGFGVIDTKRRTTLSDRLLLKVVWVTNGRVSSIKNIR